MKNKFSILSVALLCAVSIVCAMDETGNLTIVPLSTGHSSETTLRQRAKTTGTAIDLVENNYPITLRDGTTLTQDGYFNQYVSPNSVSSNIGIGALLNNEQIGQLKEGLPAYSAEGRNKEQCIFIAPGKNKYVCEFESLNFEKIQQAYVQLSAIKNSSQSNELGKRLFQETKRRIECENLAKDLAVAFAASRTEVAKLLAQKDFDKGLETENQDLKAQIAILTAMLQKADNDNAQDVSLNENEDAADFYEDDCCCTIL